MSKKSSPDRVVYPKHLKAWELEPYYSIHIAAMTSEQLHDKAEIAEQLAWRDQRIAKLQDEVAQLAHFRQGPTLPQPNVRIVIADADGKPDDKPSCVSCQACLFPHETICPHCRVRRDWRMARLYPHRTNRRRVLPGGGGAMSRLPKNAALKLVPDLNERREELKDAGYQGSHKHAPRQQAYHDAHSTDAHSAVMGMINRLAGTLAAHDDNFDAIFAAVEWGDGIDYGEDVVAPSAELRGEAAMFLKRMARSAATKLGAALPVPDVSPTVDGYIDLHWGQGQTRELLFCVRGNGQASFFGRAPGKSIKGTADTNDDNIYLAAWLTEK